MKKIFLFISCAIFLNTGYGQELVEAFTINKSDKQFTNNEQLLTIKDDLQSFSILNIEDFSRVHAKIKRNKETTFQLQLPISDKETITLIVAHNNVFADDFQVIEKSDKGDKIVPFNKPLHFTGTVRGEASSLVGLTVSEEQLMGVISYKGSNYNLELYEQNKEMQSYLLYRQEDYKHPLNLDCGTEELEFKSISQEVDPRNSSRSSAVPIEVYLECDYHMYQENNRNTRTTARYATNLFNTVANIFRTSANVTINISKIAVWNTPDPYRISENNSGHDSFDNFKARTSSFDGHIAQLLSTSSVMGFGGIGSVGNCGQERKNYSFSAGLNNSYNSNLSIYSWDINVMAHELGHNLGASHTHACVWNGNNTPIDCCGYDANEQSCGCRAGIPRKGTIMSYCGRDKDLSQGFHPQVGAVIYQVSTCTGRGNNNISCACTNQFYDDICEDFESYSTSQTLGLQSGCWIPWNGSDGSYQDVYVAPIGSSKALHISGTNADGGPQDMVLQLGDKRTGIYDLEFSMLIDERKRAYYNIQHQFQPGEIAEWASSVYFNGYGRGTLRIQGDDHSFSYPTGRWITVRQRINLSRDLTALYINNVLIDSWPFSSQASKVARGLNQLSAINFYPIDNTYDFYVDDIQLTKSANTQALSPSIVTAESAIEVFPNPASDLLNVHLKDLRGETIELHFINVTGQIIDQQVVLNNGTTQIDVSDIPKGIYLIQAIDSTGMPVTEKVVIK